MKKIIGAALAAVALAALTTGCDDGPEPGPAGKVVGRDKDTDVIHHPKIGSTPAWTSVTVDYELTTQDPETGSTTEFEVSSGTYDDCAQGDDYPACAE